MRCCHVLTAALLLTVLLFVTQPASGRRLPEDPRAIVHQSQEAPLHDHGPLPNADVTRDDDEDSAVQERAFVDLMPHVGSFLLRGFIRRALIRPVVGGVKRLIPVDFYRYYQQKLLSKRFFKMVTPLSPMVSSYAYNKVEQGIIWSLKKGYTYVSDNFIEWETEKK